MQNYFKYKNISTDSAQIFVTTPPVIASPEERGEAIVIPGRSGAIWKSENAWNEITITPTVWIPPSAPLDALRLWLTGAGDLTLARNAVFYYRARVSTQIDFSPLNFGDGHQAAIPFTCQPFRYQISSAPLTIGISGTTINNPFAVFSEPRITINGSGDVYISIGGVSFSIHGMSTGTIIDTEIMEAYKAELLLNHKMSGAFPVLAPGANVVTWEGNVTSLRVEPRWRTL